VAALLPWSFDSIHECDRGVESRTGAVVLVSRWPLTKRSRRRLSPVWLGSVSCCRVGPGNLAPSLPQIRDVNLSLHPARATLKKAAAFHQDKELLRLPVDSILTWVTCPLRSRELPRFFATTKQCAPDRRIGTFSLVGLPLVPFPLASPAWFSSSIRKPGLGSRLLCIGTPHGQYVGNLPAVPRASG